MGKEEKEEGVGRKRNLYPLISAVNIKRPPQALKLVCSQGLV